MSEVLLYTDSICSPESPATFARSFAAFRKDTELYCGSRLRKGDVFAYVGLSQNLKDLKDRTRQLQGFLAHEKKLPHRTLKGDYVWGQKVPLGRGVLLMSEVPMHLIRSFRSSRFQFLPTKPNDTPFRRKDCKRASMLSDRV